MRSFRVDNEIGLRTFREKDAEEIFAAVTTNYEHLRPFLHWVVPDYSLDSAKEFIARDKRACDEGKSESYGIFYRQKLAGAVGFVKFDAGSKYAEIGYWIARHFEGRGIVTKSCKALLDYAFEDLKMNRVEIRAATENTKSRAIPERLGFQLEGVLRQSMWRHTRFYDVAVYGILAGEWRR